MQKGKRKWPEGSRDDCEKNTCNDYDVKRNEH